VELLDFHQTREVGRPVAAGKCSHIHWYPNPPSTLCQVKGVKFTGYAAGHVLGAAMFEICIDEVSVLYTGDYSMEEDRHLKAAEVCSAPQIANL